MSEQGSPVGTELPDADINAIMRMIPHRYPFLLVDRVVEMRAFQHAVGIKSVTMNEWYFPGHFPADPIMPGVLLIEAMAQTAAVLAVAGLGADHQGHPVYFMSIDSARFRRPVRPGDQLRIEIAVLRGKLGVWKFDGKAKCDGAVAAEAQFNAKITYR
ncbi:MAG: 3-hydroxyacyl-ACP dehydratase FabZ [Geminicoccaceae bacterium]